MEKKNTLILIYFSFILVNCKLIDPEPKPTATFTYSENDYGTIFFNLNSTNSNEYFWDFGDGNKDQRASPIHKYKRNGRYTVILIAKGVGGEISVNNTVAVTKVPGNISFWTSNAPYIINVTVDDKYTSTITKNFAIVPSCSDDGTASFPFLQEGNHSFVAKEVNRLIPRTWKGNFVITSGGCYKINLTIN